MYFSIVANHGLQRYNKREPNVARSTKPKKVIVFSDRKEREPFTEWLFGLKDSLSRQRIMIRIRRLEQGNFGECESVGDGVSELRLFFGPGYRVYFGEDSDNVVILLSGGDKNSQKKDIKQPKNIGRST